MKQLLIGGITGYLLTSIFSISAPPAWFWWACLFSVFIFALVFVGWRRFNDDMHEGEF